MGRLLQNLPISCVQNPTSGHEQEYGEEFLYRKTLVPKKVVIIGGGPAGMKQRISLRVRGIMLSFLRKKRCWVVE
jgi:2,4-dienoyl-CoA reductase (NADPH2)